MPRVSAPTTAVDVKAQPEPPQVVPGFSLLQIFEGCIIDGHRIDPDEDPKDLIDTCFLQLDEGLPRSIASLRLGKNGRMVYAVRNCQSRLLIAPSSLFNIITQDGRKRVSLKDHELGRIPHQEGTREVVLVLDNSPQPAQVEGKFVVVSLVPLPTDTSVGAVRTREAALQHVRRVMTSSEKSKQ